MEVYFAFVGRLVTFLREYLGVIGVDTWIYRSSEVICFIPFFHFIPMIGKEVLVVGTHR